LQTFTIMGWIKTTVVQRAIAANGGYAYGGWHIGLDGAGKIQIEAMIGGVAIGESVSGSTGGLNTGTWQHIVVVIKQSNRSVTVYLNGKVDGAGTFTGDIYYTGTSNTYIGRRQYPGSELYWNDIIDEVRIYNRVLTTEEVRSLYAGNTIRSGLVGEWLMDHVGKEPWLSLFSSTDKFAKFYVLTGRPTTLTVRSSEYEYITLVQMTVPDDTVMFETRTKRGDIFSDSTPTIEEGVIDIFKLTKLYRV
jgi:hypothetical protein